MMVDQVLAHTIPAAYALLPEKMRSTNATAMLLAIGLHEGDGFTARWQYHGGPAHSFWQWEYPTVKAIMLHSATSVAVDGLIDALCYRLLDATVARQARALHDAMTHNDTLACGLSRCLLWTLPVPLPGPTDASTAFHQYIQAWNPGAYRKGTDAKKIDLRARFSHCFAEAWARVNAMQGGS